MEIKKKEWEKETGKWQKIWQKLEYEGHRQQIHSLLLVNKEGPYMDTPLTALTLESKYNKQTGKLCK